MLFSPTRVDHLGDLMGGESHMHAASAGLGVNVRELTSNHDCFLVCDGNLRCDGEGTRPGKRSSTRLLNDLGKGENPICHPCQQFVARILVELDVRDAFRNVGP